MRIIDSHVHVLDNYPPMAPFQDLGRPDRILALMDACEVEKTVMLPIVADFSPNNNEECAQWVRDHPDRFALLANVQLEQPDAVERVDEAKEKLGEDCLPGDARWHTPPMFNVYISEVIAIFYY